MVTNKSRMITSSNVYHVYLFLLELITPFNGHLFSLYCEEKGKIVGGNIIPVITGNALSQNLARL